jgi:hypothetical protein
MAKKKSTAAAKHRVAEGKVKAYNVASVAPSGGRRVRKNMDMDQGKLDLAKRALGVRTETDAVDAALDLVVFQAEVFSGIDQAVAAGGFADVYED